MDILGRLLGGGQLRAGTPGPGDDFWYQPVGMMTEAGTRIDTDAAKKISAWYRGRDILATVLAMLPLQIFERLPDDGGSQRAKDHPLYDVVHDRPNAWQDSFQWRRQKMYHLIDHGNGYDRIIAGDRGFVHELRPIHPSLVTPRQLPGTGRIVYDVKDPKTMVTRPLTQDEVFHLRGASDDGIAGKGILEYARGSLGTAAATESYAANIFSRGTLSGGVIENPGLLDKEAGKRMAESFVTSSRNWHMPKVLEQGSKFVESEMTPDKAQMLTSREFTVDDIARWLGVPRLMLENSDPSFGNAEQFTQNFIDFMMGPWLTLWEFAINSQLVLAPHKFFAQFTRQALVRGNFKERVEGLVLLKNAGIISADEARATEDMNKRGGKADELVEPQNITGKPTAPSAAAPAPQPGKRQAIADGGSRAHAIVIAEATRILKTEVGFVQKSAVKFAADVDGFASAIADFYGNHAGYVSQRLLVSRAAAKAYCERQRAQIACGDWTVALELWKTNDYAAGLAALALEEEAA